jgi:DNA processing protein
MVSRGQRLRLACCALHPDRSRRLLSEWGSARAVLRALEKGQVEAGDAVRTAAEVSASDRLAELNELGVAPLFRGRPGYPAGLAELPDAPDVLFLRGTAPDRLGVAVIGTRRCSRYGRSLARAFGRSIAAAGWPLVSGLARGVDGEAHQGTAEGQGLGVAVLGSGPDVWYPPEHRDLGLRLVDLGGAIVTEYPPGTAPEGWRFPPRKH